MEKETSVQERRKFVRLNSAVDIQYQLLDKETSKRLETKTRNISAGGICMIADEELEIDNILVLSIYLPKESMPIIAKGRVAWVEPFEIAKEGRHFDVGIEFFEISPDDRKRIAQYVFSVKKS